MNNITVSVTAHKRSRVGQLARFPSVIWHHYKELRREHGRIVALYAAWLWAGFKVKVE